MTSLAPIFRARTCRMLPLAAALAFTSLAGPAFAETAEQREACAPDAINLCPDTIPDVAKTTACMQRHEAELSPRCRRVFNEATGGGSDNASAPPPPPREENARRAPTEEDGYGPRRFGYIPDDDDGLNTSREVIARMCAEGTIDRGTCRRTAAALRDAR